MDNFIGPYVCPYCSKNFKTKQRVERHILIHTGEKPYACTECEYKTNRQDHLKEHFILKHRKM